MIKLFLWVDTRCINDFYETVIMYEKRLEALFVEASARHGAARDRSRYCRAGNASNCADP